MLETDKQPKKSRKPRKSKSGLCIICMEQGIEKYGSYRSPDKSGKYCKSHSFPNMISDRSYRQNRRVNKISTNDSEEENKRNISKYMSNLSRKLYNYKRSDMRKCKREGTIQVADVQELFIRQDYKCYICNERILLKFTPYCYYQYSIDRIDEKKPHDKGNCLISCYFCNCIEYQIDNNKLSDENNMFKICRSGCHKDRKEFKITYDEVINRMRRYSISDDIIRYSRYFRPYPYAKSTYIFSSIDYDGLCTYELCKNKSIYGYRYPLQRCESHAQYGMLKYPHKKCEIEKCREIALYGETEQNRCIKHKKETDISLVFNRGIVCNTCKSEYNIYKPGQCDVCCNRDVFALLDINLDIRNQKPSKEERFKRHVERFDNSIFDPFKIDIDIEIGRSSRNERLKKYISSFNARHSDIINDLCLNAEWFSYISNNFQKDEQKAHCKVNHLCTGLSEVSKIYSKILDDKIIALWIDCNTHYCKLCEEHNMITISGKYSINKIIFVRFAVYGNQLLKLIHHKERIDYINSIIQYASQIKPTCKTLLIDLNVIDPSLIVTKELKLQS
jgi:hypothetical protein